MTDRGMEKALAANEIMARNLTDNIRTLIFLRIRTIRRAADLTDRERRTLLLDLEAKAHAGLIGGMDWALRRCDHHVHAVSTPGSAWTDEGEA